MEQESKVNPELQRVAELLRPLWPGVVMEATPEQVRLDGRQDRVKLTVIVAEPGCGMSHVTATLDHHMLLRAFWRTPEEAAGKLKEHRDYVRGMVDSLNGALGLEVQNG